MLRRNHYEFAVDDSETAARWCSFRFGNVDNSRWQLRGTGSCLVAYCCIRDHSTIGRHEYRLILRNHDGSIVAYNRNRVPTTCRQCGCYSSPGISDNLLIVARRHNGLIARLSRKVSMNAIDRRHVYVFGLCGVPWCLRTH